MSCWSHSTQLFHCLPVQRVLLSWRKSSNYSLSNWGCYTTAFVFLFLIFFRFHFGLCDSSSAQQYHYIYMHYMIHNNYNTIPVCKISFSEVLFSWIKCINNCISNHSPSCCLIPFQNCSTVYMRKKLLIYER